MHRIAVLLLLGLAGCAAGDTAGAEGRPVEMQGWRMASGRAPSKAEFEAVVAACQDRPKSGSLDACLATMGLKRSP